MESRGEGARRCCELGVGVHGGFAQVWPEGEREGAESECRILGQLGCLHLEVQGAGRRVAMEVGRTAVHGGHAAFCRTGGVRE